jgi:8-oxo-dGTP pyrophosphatase MutT (NUDIX family)
MMEKTPPHRRGAVAVIVRDGRLLVIRRAQCVVAPGKFCFPGGGIEPGESEEGALAREIQEELNVAVRPQRRLWRSITPWGVELAWWLSDLAPGDTPLPNPLEVESIHWHTPDEMAVLPDLLESNQSFLVALARGEFRLDGDSPEARRKT